MKINLNNLNYLLKNIQNVQNKQNLEGTEFNSQEAAKNSPSLHTENLPIVESAKFNSITKAQLAALVKELLSIPKEFNELLALLMYKEITPETLKKLIEEQGKNIELSQIKELLEGNSKEVVNKLIKLMQSGNGFNADQFKEITGLISQLVTNSDAPHEIMKNTILLYLPWMPLASQQDININLGNEENSDENEESENVALVMYVSTMYLGKFKVTIILNADNTLTVIMQSDCENEEINAYIEKIQFAFKEEMQSSKISADTQIISGAKKGESTNEKREISLHPTKSVSPKVMIAAYTLTRVIFEHDKSIELTEQRQKMI